jgi:hypothetical protein
MQRLSHPLVNALRWFANIFSVLLLFFFLVMLGGGLGGRTPNLAPLEVLFFVLIGIQLVGLLIAFRWEVTGALAILAAHALHLVLAPSALANPYFAAPALTALLRLLCWWLDRRWAPQPASINVPPPRSPWPAIAIWSVVVVFLGMALSEIAISPPLMAEQEIAIPAGLAGRWRGQARVMNTWVHARALPVELVVGADGTAEGTVGDARFVRARLLPNQSWFGRALRIQTAYMFRGEVEGPVIAAEGIGCGPAATIVFDLESGQLKGGLHLACTGAASRGRMPLSMFFDLDRANP